MNFSRKTIIEDECYLRQISLEVDFQNDDYMKYVENLKEYCKNNYVYALAPVQIGIPKRIIYIKNTIQNMENNLSKDYDESLIFINPVIKNMRGCTSFLEACDSCIFYKGDKKVYYAGKVLRPYSIEVEYFDINENKKSEIISGFPATVFCHEYDHLNGILHMDKINEVLEMTLE